MDIKTVIEADNLINDITSKVSKEFATFGTGIEIMGNPLSNIKDQPPTFAAGVDVQSVVSFVIAEVLTYVRDVIYKE